MKKVRSLVTVAIVLLCLGVFAGCETNGKVADTTGSKDAKTKEQTIYEQEFTLKNLTGLEINNIYISPAGEEKWGTDILTTDKLSSGSAAEIVFSTGEKVKYWDMKATDKSGKEILWRDIDLFTVSEITLKLEGTMPTISIK